MDGCSYCNRSNPSKRCSKRHTKCLKKLFCDKVCEQAAHKKVTVVSSEGQENLQESTTTGHPDTKAKAAADANKKKKDKKAKKKPNAGTTRCSGEFWWAWYPSDIFQLAYLKSYNVYASMPWSNFQLNIKPRMSCLNTCFSSRFLPNAILLQYNIYNIAYCSSSKTIDEFCLLDQLKT